MKFCKYFIGLLFAATLFGCEENTELSDFQEYSFNGLSFSYPGNWTVTTEVDDGGNIRYVAIQSSGNAIAAISLFEKDHKISLDLYVKTFVDNYYEPIPIITRNDGVFFTQNIIIEEKNYNRIRNKFIVSIAGYEVPNTSDFYKINTVSKGAIIYTQTPDKYLDKVTVGFEKVLHTLSVD